MKASGKCSVAKVEPTVNVDAFEPIHWITLFSTRIKGPMNSQTATIESKSLKVRLYSVYYIRKFWPTPLLYLQYEVMYLHKLKRRFEILHRVHLYSEKLDPHDETNGALDHGWTLLLLPELLQLVHELLLHGRKPGLKKRRVEMKDNVNAKKHDRAALLVLLWNQ